MRKTMSARRPIILSTLFCILLVFAGKHLPATASENDWPTSTGNAGSHRHFSGTQITPQSISDLTMLWRFNSGFSLSKDTVQASPVFTGSSLIAVNLAGDVIAIDPENGGEIWRTNLETPVGRRGLTFVADTQGGAGKLFVATGKKIVSLDAKTGVTLQIFKTGTSLLQPHTDGKKLYVATLVEGVKAFDLDSGALIWQRSLNTEGVKIRIWSGFSYDAKNGKLLITTSNPGGLIGRDAKNQDYSVSIVALHTENGAVDWQYQHIRNDVWDLDLVGNPIIVHGVQLQGTSETKDIVIGLAKTGDIIVLDIKDGSPAVPNSIFLKAAYTNNAKGKSADKLFQKKVVWPQPVSSISLDLNKDFSHLQGENAAYVTSKLRNAKTGWYVPPSPDYDVAMYGLHGGPEWPGAALYPTREGNQLLIPHNNNPWVLRLEYTDKHLRRWKRWLKPVNFISSQWANFTSLISECWNQPFSCKRQYTANKSSEKLSRWAQKTWESPISQSNIINSLYSKLPGAITHPVYQSQCSQCHGVARQGAYQSELHGDGFRPSLVGLHLKEKQIKTDTLEKLLSLHTTFDVPLSLSNNEYTEMMSYFRKADNAAFADNRFKVKGFWQILLDKSGLPATTPPWGMLTSIDLKSGAHNWSVPLGIRKKDSAEPIKGDINFGGVMTNAGGIGFATGTPDRSLYGYNMENGEMLWQSKLPYAGSAPPIGFSFRGCDIIVVTATGGRFVGFTGNGDSTIAYKLKSCEFKN